MQQASCLEGGPLLWIWPLYLHVNQKSDDDDDDDDGQEWTLPAQLGQLKTGQDGKGLLQSHLWCPDDLPRLWDRIEIEHIATYLFNR